MSLAASLDRLLAAWQQLEIPNVEDEIEVFFPRPPKPGVSGNMSSGALNLSRPNSNMIDGQKAGTPLLYLSVFGTRKIRRLPESNKYWTEEIPRSFRERKLLFAGLASHLKRQPGFATAPVRQDGKEGLLLSKHYFASDDWSLTWTYNHDSGSTRAILLYWMDGGSSFVEPFLQELEDVQDCLGQAVLLGFIASKMTLSKVVLWNEQCNTRLLYVDQNIKLLSMTDEQRRAKLLSMTREQKLAAGVEDKLEYGTVSMQLHDLSDFVIKIRRYLRYLDQYNTFMLRENAQAPVTLIPRQDEMAESLQSLVSYVAIWTLKNEAMAEQVANQAFALNSFIMRDDADMSLKIAKDGRMLAVESKRDSASMKTIAIVSMIFLPGTFVASFFAMPMFDWNMPAGHNVSSRSFWIYWTVVGPLTILVFALWQSGLIYKRWIEKKQDAAAMRDLKHEDSTRQHSKPATQSLPTGFIASLLGILFKSEDKASPRRRKTQDTSC
jgi:hypothetical protein